MTARDTDQWRSEARAEAAEIVAAAREEAQALVRSAQREAKAAAEDVRVEVARRRMRQHLNDVLDSLDPAPS